MFDDITTGAGNDIEQATTLARKMVCEWGMSEMGPLTYGKKEEQIFLGREIAQHRDYSEDTAIRIDKEVKELVESANGTATKILSDNIQVLHDMAKALLERETIVLEDIQELIDRASGNVSGGGEEGDSSAENVQETVAETGDAETTDDESTDQQD